MIRCCNICFSSEFYAVQNIFVCTSCSTIYQNIPIVINAMPTDIELGKWLYLKWQIDQKLISVGIQEGESEIDSGNTTLQNI